MINKRTANLGFRRAFTLVEVLVAVWILGTTLVALLGIHIANLKIARKIDEMSNAVFLTFSVPSETYIKQKYNVDIYPTEVPEGYKVEVNAYDFSTMLSSVIPFLGNIKMPVIPTVKIFTPSQKSIEILGKPSILSTVQEVR
ncbi:hypothetical protein HRbin19_00696 [bacterium HR19]|nr:hypothetical protein HRbin19_00696 [bacterium HR19]